ncbi:MAG TPA: threonine--tRNA ligase [Candidatus Omnitrophota bacterium]|nr:threonine--tRNA ligase [Candidatus Omnitrophota bacterium]HPS19771.1 threonine--tRNA ligase [Candidatus Omnitrophota bacterium]
MAKKVDENLVILRHSAAHVMADAVKRLYPGVKLGIGPAIEDGFYYDFDCSKALTVDDLANIEKEMARIVGQNLKFERKVVSKKDAEKIFRERGESYKVELLADLGEDQEITIYSHGDFMDLCRGPHIGSTGEIKAFKLLAVAGAYWRGSEENAMLQRIYGTAFASQEELENYLKLREEALKRDHRKLGKELDLFSFNDISGAGLVLYHPKGAMLRQLVVDYITEKHLEKNYQLIYSPHIMKRDIWIRSGHYDYYKENMYFFESDKQEYAVKPMNCPGHILVYASRTRSYKEFPIRYFELGNVYRHEKSGVLHGLLRVRGFTQDDAHIFCLRDQVVSEINNVIDFVKETLHIFGFGEFEVELSTRPEKSIGTDADWEQATLALKNALDTRGLKYDINEGDGAFYGPKIDIKLKDAIGRSWQCATIQCDFNLPERFDLKYIDSDGKEKRPIMLHRVILGSLERFIGALIENYSGNFPLWLAPVQVMVIPISEAHAEYALKLRDMLHRNRIRVEIDLRAEKMQRKIRDAELDKIPYMAIVGKKEMESGTVSVRSRKEGDLGAISLDAFMGKLSSDIESKK